MDAETLQAFGKEIKRLREVRPRITIRQVAEAAQVAPNTVSAVQAGTGVDDSLEKVLRAMETLGRPVTLAWPERTVEAKPYPHPADVIGDLVKSILRAAPPDEATQLEADIWAIVRNRPEQICERLGWRRE